MKNGYPPKRTFPAAPKQSLGQNFCTDPNILEKITAAAKLSADSTVVEIGAGAGALTSHLVSTKANVISIEIDQRMTETLEKKFADTKNLTLVYGDGLKLLPEVLAPLPEDTVVVGNLPYNISSQLILKMIENRHKISRGIFTLQYEMGVRLSAGPGSKDYGTLSVRARAVSQVELLFKISPKCFYPPPKVDSACMRMDFRKGPKIAPKNDEIFVRTVRSVFSKRRKQIRNSLSSEFGADVAVKALETAEIDPKSRPETIDYEGYFLLSDALFELITQEKS